MLLEGERCGFANEIKTRWCIRPNAITFAWMMDESQANKIETSSRQQMNASTLQKIKACVGRVGLEERSWGAGGVDFERGNESGG